MQLLVAYRERGRHADRPTHRRGRCPAHWYNGCRPGRPARDDRGGLDDGVGHLPGLRRPPPEDRDPHFAQGRHGLRHGPHRSRDAVPAPRELLARPGRAVLRGRHRHCLRLHLDLHRRAHGVTERDADVASGLLNTSQNLGIAIGIAIGVAVASSIAASHFHTLIHHGCATAAALTGGFQLALWVCALTGLAAVPAAVPLIRRTERPNAVSIARVPEATMAMVGE